MVSTLIEEKKAQEKQREALGVAKEKQ